MDCGMSPFPPLPTFSLPSPYLLPTSPYRSTLSQVLKLLVYETLSYWCMRPLSY